MLSYLDMVILILVIMEVIMNKISTREIFTVLVSLFILVFPTVATQVILKKGNTSSLLILIIGFILCLIPLFIIIHLSNKLNNKSIFKYNKDNFKTLGSIINILYILLFLFLLFILSFTILNFTINQLLVRNSYYVVALIYSSLIALAVCKGKEIICRASLILYFILIISMIFGFIMLIPEISLDNVLPIVSINYKNIIGLSFTIPSYSVLLFISILCLKREDIIDKEKLNKRIIQAYLLGSLIILLFYFFVISVYGIELASIYIYPEYYLFKKINLFNFIQRVENIMATLFYISSFSGICFMIYFIKIYFKDTFKIKNKVKINIFVFILTILISFFSTFMFSHYKIQILILKFPYIFGCIFIVLLINFLLSIIKRG